MSGYFTVGGFFVVVGLVFLLVPLEQLQKAFRHMRSKVTTKLGGAVFLALGLFMVVEGFLVL